MKETSAKNGETTCKSTGLWSSCNGFYTPDTLHGPHHHERDDANDQAEMEKQREAVRKGETTR